jgi:hypothetical protein
MHEGRLRVLTTSGIYRATGFGKLRIGVPVPFGTLFDDL